MKILEFKHAGTPRENRELFGLIGEYAASPAVSRALGGPVTSEPGRVWLVAVAEGAGEVTAFASLRFRNRTAAMLHLYAREEGGEIPLLEACLEKAEKAGAARLVTTDWWSRREFYFRYGFQALCKVGRFMRLEKGFRHDAG